MKDRTCVEFLQWALPRLRMRWPGFRKVRNQVCKRIDRRIDELGLADVEAYRGLLLRDENEWETLGAFCRITISRFYRDSRVFDRIVGDVLPALAEGRDRVRCWSAGCASGEEPYSLAVCWRDAAVTSPRAELPGRTQDAAGNHPRAELDILASDVDPHMLDRASRGCYQRGTLKELADALIERAFERTGPNDEPYCIRDLYREHITWMRHDIRDDPPRGPFDLILCRNLVFTYFEEELQDACLERLLSVLRPGGGLVVGKHEELPPAQAVAPWYENERIFRRH